MWLETITVRTRERQQLENQLPELTAQLAADYPEVQVLIYWRYPAISDLSLHLIHPAAPIQMSKHGLYLAAALECYGTVDHAVWKAVEH